MKQHLTFCLLLAAAALPAAAHAQDAEPAGDFTITGSVTGVSQYRLRGISLSDEDFALQGGITVAHSSGFYVGTWASSLAGFGTFGGANTELDGIIGYSATLGDTTLDGGLIWYFYPGTSGHTYEEIYVSVTQPIGPVEAKLGANYAPSRASIGDNDNLWVYGDLSAPIPSTPIVLKGHLGYTTGEGSIFSGPTGEYFDYSLGADITVKNLTLNVSYVGTDIDSADADAYFTVPGGRPGSDIVDGTVLVSLTAAF